MKLYFYAPAENVLLFNTGKCTELHATTNNGAGRLFDQRRADVLFEVDTHHNLVTIIPGAIDCVIIEKKV